MAVGAAARSSAASSERSLPGGAARPTWAVRMWVLRTPAAVAQPAFTGGGSSHAACTALPSQRQAAEQSHRTLLAARPGQGGQGWSKAGGAALTPRASDADRRVELDADRAADQVAHHFGADERGWAGPGAAQVRGSIRRGGSQKYRWAGVLAGHGTACTRHAQGGRPAGRPVAALTPASGRGSHPRSRRSRSCRHRWSRRRRSGTAVRP